MKYSGIDLHSNNCMVLVSDESDRVLVSRRVPNSVPLVLQTLEAHREDIVGVVVEATFNWYWLVDGLQAAGYRVHLANASAIKQYEGLKRIGDEADAAHLAHLLRLGLLPEGYICPKPLRAVRDLSRKRMQLVRSRTQHILAVENIQARESGCRMNVKQIKQLDTQSVKAAMPQLLPEVQLALQANVAVIGELGKQIDKLERCLRERMRPSEDFRLLKTTPGIGETLATTIMLETGTVARFARVGNFSSYCRCVDSERVSNGKKKGQGNVKNGNAYLAWAFIEAANYAHRYCPEAKRFYERKKARTNNIVATKALAHKLARACYHMLREQKPFEVKRCFG
jgi:transposase